MILQLNPTIPVFVVSKNQTGYALALIDYSQEHDLKWVVALDNVGEIWVIPNKDIRAQKNYSLTRNVDNKASQKINDKCAHDNLEPFTDNLMESSIPRCIMCKTIHL